MGCNKRFRDLSSSELELLIDTMHLNGTTLVPPHFRYPIAVKLASYDNAARARDRESERESERERERAF